MFNLFKSNKKYPSFELLKTFTKQNHYFIRTAQWDWLNRKNIFVIDPLNPRMLTLDPWPQLIFLAADGQMSVTEYVFHAANGYKKHIPEMLDETIINELKSLEEYGIVKFVEIKQNPELKHHLSKSEFEKRKN